ncbi:MAG: tetratricopeptide repeat protein [Proteobacteria bacterium]|nr:tetratricopeptide repeat protein [Pseudomonadota bacterium]
MLLGTNEALEYLERLGWIETSRPSDRVQFVEERLFAPDGRGNWHSTPYAEETLVRQSFPQEKGDTYRIFALGGSFMMGSPYLLQGYPNVAGGMPFFLEEALGRGGSSRPVEVINVAAGAQNSSRVRGIVEQVFTLDPDALYIATCNNEGEPAPSTMRVWLNRQGGYRLLSRLLDEERAGSWYTPQDPDTRRIRDGFRANLRWVLSEAEKREVPVFLATLPVNLAYRGWDTGGHIIGEAVVPAVQPAIELPAALPIPAGFELQPKCVTGSLLFEAEEFETARPLLRACLRSDDPPDRLSRVRPAYSAIADYEVGTADAASDSLLEVSLGACLARGVRLYYQERWDEAIGTFEQCEDPAEALRWIGFVERARGNLEAASDLLEQVVELAPRNRCRPSFNAIIREEAARFSTAILIDLEAHAKAVSPGGLPGPQLYVDYCHMNWRGYASMTRPVAAAIADHEPSLELSWPDIEAIARDAGLPSGGNAEQVRVTNEWARGDVMAPPNLP